MQRRHDRRRRVTSIALIEAAESLFAWHGVDGVSTRQLGAAIGSSNTNVVAYHFGSKEALVEAVYRHRLPALDRRRGELLRAADDAGKGGCLKTLMHAFALPLFEQTDANGMHSYARFVAAIERSGLIATRGEVEGDFPETARLVQRIVAALPQSDQVQASTRIRLAMAMIVASLQIADQDASEVNGTNAALLFEAALNMATAGLAAPLSLPNFVENPE